MWFIKKQFISFIKEEKYKCLCEVFKKDKTIKQEQQIFDEKPFKQYISEKIEEIPQTYTSTITFTLNQGVIKGCKKENYLKKEIDFNNIKILCLDEYSFYISLFDLKEIKKEYPFIDFIYSPFAIIDYLAKERKNRFYILIFEYNLIVLGYENFIPIFGDILPIHQEKEELEDLDLIEEIDDISEDLSDIDADIENIDEEELEEKLNDLIPSNIESKILEFIQNSLKEYYSNYSSEFIEKIILFDTFGIDKKLRNIIEEEILIECEYQQIDILKTLNRISLESI